MIPEDLHRYLFWLVHIKGRSHLVDVEEVRAALKRGARLASVGTLETVLFQALKGWLQNVSK
jgi:hypothetical protein